MDRRKRQESHLRESEPRLQASSGMASLAETLNKLAEECGAEAAARARLRTGGDPGLSQERERERVEALCRAADHRDATKRALELERERAVAAALRALLLHPSFGAPAKL